MHLVCFWNVVIISESYKLHDRRWIYWCVNPHIPIRSINDTYLPKYDQNKDGTPCYFFPFFILQMHLLYDVVCNILCQVVMHPLQDSISYVHKPLFYIYPALWRTQIVTHKSGSDPKCRIYPSLTNFKCYNCIKPLYAPLLIPTHLFTRISTYLTRNSGLQTLCVIFKPFVAIQTTLHLFNFFKRKVAKWLP